MKSNTRKPKATKKPPVTASAVNIDDLMGLTDSGTGSLPVVQPSATDIKVKATHEDAKPPHYSTPGSACMDFFNCDGFAVVPARGSKTFSVGWAMQLPPGSTMLMFSRSGQGFNHGVRLANCVGVIDSDYRGEIKVKLTNDSDEAYEVNQHDRIAQGLILEGVRRQTFALVDQLDETDRGEGGFGSTGK